ncbi:MAG: dipeptidase [Firmicutes bacterium]|nr:dipeptidase [Bacillota bacterium]
MGIKTAYQDYQAFQYLEAEKDYTAIEFPVGDRRVPEFLLELSPMEEARVAALAEQLIYIDAHSHPYLLPREFDKDIAAYVRQGRMACAYAELSRSYIDAVFDNLLDGMCTIQSKRGWKWEDVIYDYGMRMCDLAHQDFVIRCERVDDIYYAHSVGKIALIPVLESAMPIENEVDRVDILFGLGIRQMGLVYSESNALGSGLREDKDGGLTKFGQDVVERMNKTGMLIDVSHCGVQTALDAINCSKKPLLISHVGSRTLWDSRRMMPDEAIIACAKKGGVIAVEASPHTTMTKTNPSHSIFSVMEHFEYIKNLVGIDHVAFGMDAMYGDHVGLHHYFTKEISTQGMQGSGFTEVEYVKGLENPTEASKNIFRYLVMRNYSKSDMEKVLSGNIIRVLRKNWPI